MSFPDEGGKLRSISANSEGDATPSGAGEFAQAVSAALKAEYGGRGAAVKRVARMTGANQRAVKNWFEARNAPSGYYLVLLAGHSEAILRLILSRAGKHGLLVSFEFAAAKQALLDALAAFSRVEN